MQKTIPDRSEKFAYIQKCRNHGGGISNHTECLPKFSRLLTFKIIKRTANFFLLRWRIGMYSAHCAWCVMPKKWNGIRFYFHFIWCNYLRANNLIQQYTGINRLKSSMMHCTIATKCIFKENENNNIAIVLSNSSWDLNVGPTVGRNFCSNVPHASVTWKYNFNHVLTLHISYLWWALVLDINWVYFWRPTDSVHFSRMQIIMSCLTPYGFNSNLLVWHGFEYIFEINSTSLLFVTRNVDKKAMFLPEHERFCSEK